MAAERTAIGRLQGALKAELFRAQTDVVAALETLGRVHAERLTGGSRDEDHASAIARLSKSLAKILGAGDLSGRLEIRFPSKKAPSPEEFAARDVIANAVPVVAFDEAVRDLMERDPVGAAELKRAGLEVEDLYGGVQTPEGIFYPHGFSAARAADAEVAKAVRDRLVSGLAAGTPTPTIVAELVAEWAWPSAYAANVCRTTFNTATTAGRFVEAERVSSAGIPVAFRFSAVLDSNTRPGHAAMDGVTADVRDNIWRNWSPPLDFQCRCVLEAQVGEEIPIGSVSVPAGASKAPGFGTRSDLRRYG